MKRERIEKGINRINEFFENHNNGYNPFEGMFEDPAYKEAWTRTLMEFDDTELDYETAKWFEEDESKYQKLMEKAARDLEFISKFTERLSQHYDELEQKEEDNEDTMDNL